MRGPPGVAVRASLLAARHLEAKGQRVLDSDYGAPMLWVHSALPHIPDLRCHRAVRILRIPDYIGARRWGAL